MVWLNSNSISETPLVKHRNTMAVIAPGVILTSIGDCVSSNALSTFCVNSDLIKNPVVFNILFYIG